jgi:biopolymer transport protein ExbD
MNIRGRNKVTPEFNMSSMTDIVFLLLVFFMLASTLVTTNAIDIILPKASGKTENKRSVSVSIKKDPDLLYRSEACWCGIVRTTTSGRFNQPGSTHNCVASRRIGASRKCCEGYGYSQ